MKNKIIYIFLKVIKEKLREDEKQHRFYFFTYFETLYQWFNCSVTQVIF